MGHQARQAHQEDVPTPGPTRRTSFYAAVRAHSCRRAVVVPCFGPWVESQVGTNLVLRARHRRSARPQAFDPPPHGRGAGRCGPPSPQPGSGRLPDLAVELRGGENAEAVLRISFARRSSRTSHSSSAIRLASSVVVPRRQTSSIAVRLTQVRNVSWLIPELAGNAADRSRPRGRITPRGDHHPNRAHPQLIGVLPRCRHVSHPSAG
jgi:hypothetical protein